MSDSDNERKLQLECLRLASDLMQLAKDTVNRDLKAHCLRMAKIWSDRAEQGTITFVPVLSASYH
jgi:hypothetical protein